MNKQVVEILRALRSDLERNPSLLVRLYLVNFRFASLAYLDETPRWLGKAIRMIHKVVVIPLGGGEVHPAAKIGGGIMFVHRLNGTIIHPSAEIGQNCTIYHQVTIGSSGKVDGVPQVPHIANGVTIYPGAKVLGNIEIGEGAIIGANAVVVKTVPPNCKALAPTSRLLAD